MNLYEAIFSRKSVRSYEMEPVKAALLSEIREYYSQIEGLNPGIHTEISIIDNTKGQNKRIHLLERRHLITLPFTQRIKTAL